MYFGDESSAARLFERPAAAARVSHHAARSEPARRISPGLRLASGEQLAALDGGSEQNVSRSLLALWEHEYVERLLGQVEKRVLYKGSFPLIYGLTRSGAWLLRKHGYDVRRRLLYETDKQRRAGWRFIEHRVDITEFMVRLELACRGRTDVDRARSQRYRRQCAEDATRSARAPRRQKCGLTARIVLLSVDPDELFGLRSVETRRRELLHVRARPRRDAGTSTQEQGSNVLREEDADLL